MRGIASVAIEDAAAGNYDDKVIPLFPTLLVCYVWLLQMVIHSVCQNKILLGKFCEMVGNYGCMYMLARQKREELSLNLHVFYLVDMLDFICY
jgi:dolichol kinase